jgi:hypothetical protein
VPGDFHRTLGQDTGRDQPRQPVGEGLAEGVQAGPAVARQQFVDVH